MALRWRVVVAVLAWLVGAWLLARPWWTGLVERRAQQVLSARAAARPAVGAPARLTPLGHWRPPGPVPRVYARLSIPSLGLSVWVVRGLTLTDYYDLLAWGPGHLHGTSAPGQPGNIVIFGHRDEFGSPFRDLFRLAPGAVVELAAPAGRFRYAVQRVWSTAATDLSVVHATAPGSRLTLVTCTGPGNDQRLVVQAVLVGGSGLDQARARPITAAPRVTKVVAAKAGAAGARWRSDGWAGE